MVLTSPWLLFAEDAALPDRSEAGYQTTEEPVTDVQFVPGWVTTSNDGTYLSNTKNVAVVQPHRVEWTWTFTWASGGWPSWGFTQSLVQVGADPFSSVTMQIDKPHNCNADWAWGPGCAGDRASRPCLTASRAYGYQNPFCSYPSTFVDRGAYWLATWTFPEPMIVLEGTGNIGWYLVACVSPLAEQSYAGGATIVEVDGVPVGESTPTPIPTNTPTPTVVPTCVPESQGFSAEGMMLQSENDDPGQPPICIPQNPNTPTPTPTLTPTPTPTSTLTPTAENTPTPTLTPTAQACSSELPTNWQNSVVQLFIYDPTQGNYEASLGTYIDLGRNCFLSHSHWFFHRNNNIIPTEFVIYTIDTGQIYQFDWQSKVTQDFNSVADGQALFCLDRNVLPNTLPTLQPIGSSPDPRSLSSRCSDAYVIDGEETAPTQAVPTSIQLTGEFVDFDGFIDIDEGFEFDAAQPLEEGDSGSPIIVSDQIIGIYAGGSESDDTNRAACVTTP